MLTSSDVNYMYNETDLMLHLKNRGLNVGIIFQEPWAYPCALANRPIDRSCLAGIGIEFINTLCDRLRISCTYVVHNITDSMLDSHQMLAKKIIFPGHDQTELDTALPILVETPNLRENLDFTMPVFYMEHGVLIKTQYLMSHDELLFAFRPFHWTVWIILIMAIMSTSFLDAWYKVMFHDDVKRDRSEFLKQRAGSFFVHAERSWLMVFGILLSRAIDTPISHMSRRVLMVTWGLSCIIVCGVYSAQLTSTKVALRIQQPFSDLDELAEKIRSKQFRLEVYLPDSKFIHDVQNEANGPYRHLRDALILNPPKFVTDLTNSTNVVTTSRENVGVWASQYTLKALAKTNCNVTIVPLQVTDFGSFAFKRNTLLAYLFNKVVLGFKERGYYMEKLEQKYSFGRDCENRKEASAATTDKDVVQKVELDSLQMVFWALICGALIASVGFCLEIVCHRLHKSYSLQEDGEKLQDVHIHDNKYKKRNTVTSPPIITVHNHNNNNNIVSNYSSVYSPSLS